MSVSGSILRREGWCEGSRGETSVIWLIEFSGCFGVFAF